MIDQISYMYKILDMDLRVAIDCKDWKSESHRLQAAR